MVYENSKKDTMQKNNAKYYLENVYEKMRSKDK